MVIASRALLGLVYAKTTFCLRCREVSEIMILNFMLSLSTKA